MVTITTITRHGFLTQSHNCWALWTHEGNQNLVNPGPSHRTLETLAYAVDKLTSEGWKVRNIFVDNGVPTLVFLSREEVVQQ